MNIIPKCSFADGRITESGTYHYLVSNESDVIILQVLVYVLF